MRDTRGLLRIVDPASHGGRNEARGDFAISPWGKIDLALTRRQSRCSRRTSILSLIYLCHFEKLYDQVCFEKRISSSAKIRFLSIQLLHCLLLRSKIKIVRALYRCILYPHKKKGNYLQRKLNAPTASIIELVRALIGVNLWTRTNQLLRSILSRYCLLEACTVSYIHIFHRVLRDSSTRYQSNEVDLNLVPIFL